MALAGYSVSYSFSGYQANTPNAPLPAQHIDIEFANIATAIDGLVAVANGISSMTVPVPFAAGITASATRPATTVTYLGSLYLCAVAHVTTETFDAAKWTKIVSKGDSAAAAVLRTISGTSGTISPSDAGNLVVTTNDNPVAITLETGDVAPGDVITVALRQMGLGTVGFTPAPTSFAGYAETGGQNSIVTLQYIDGVWYLDGQGA